MRELPEHECVLKVEKGRVIVNKQNRDSDEEYELFHVYQCLKVTMYF